MFIDGKKKVFGPGCPDGDVVFCEKKDLGRNALDTFQCLDMEEPELDDEPEPLVGLVKEHRGFGWYDVRDQATGKVLNDNKLTKEEAEEMALAGAGAPETEEAKAKPQNPILAKA